MTGRAARSEACDDEMVDGIRGTNPVGADQVYAALVALAAEPVADPERRPEGPEGRDLLHLLGILLARTELAIAAAQSESVADAAAVMIGWTSHAGDAPALMAAALSNRLERTAMQVSPEPGEASPGREGAFAAITAAAYAVNAQLCADVGRSAQARRGLVEAQTALDDASRRLGELRATMGRGRR